MYIYTCASVTFNGTCYPASCPYTCEIRLSVSVFQYDPTIYQRISLIIGISMYRLNCELILIYSGGKQGWKWFHTLYSLCLFSSSLSPLSLSPLSPLSLSLSLFQFQFFNKILLQTHQSDYWYPLSLLSLSPVPPGPPTGLDIVADSQTTISLSISWTNPVFNGFSPIDGFTVNLTSRHPDIDRDIPGDAMTMTANLDSLRPFTAYTIRLSVRNAVGLEGEAAVTTGMTDSLRKTQLL